MAQLNDPLQVLATTRHVVDQASRVRIDRAAVRRVANNFTARSVEPPSWDRTLHWQDNPDRTANYLLVLDALNFCFWGVWGEPRWQISYRGQLLNGYWALAAALTRALDSDIPLDEAGFLARLDRDGLRDIFAGEGEIPLLDARVANLREVGRVLLERYGGRFAQAIEEADGSAIRLVETVVAGFRSFRDVASYDGREIRFYKRAQILASDIHAAFDGIGLGRFQDLGDLTAFADYKVPQVLQQLGILRYTPELVELLGRHVEIPAGSATEVEIRAATIWGVEELRRALAERGDPLDAFQIDWLLWDAGQRLPEDVLPYHRTPTIFY